MFEYQIVFADNDKSEIFVNGDELSYDKDWFTVFYKNKRMFVAPADRVLYVLCVELEEAEVSA